MKCQQTQGNPTTHSRKCLVVTSEQPAPNSKRKIKIPDACDAMNVSYFGPFDLYRKLGLRFH
ncbi:DUF4411 family protein [Trueperella bernardiae]|uniref:DUF4411 family protein n=1 Tax=Trueperella bernardiae TaxID=59561 RepID=A0AAW6ZI12_9ACTO|nr:DUF4411 family protein [Trueperella bernardiae]MDK8602800.1 DUF4411 family protein [Trueperella bernardiae]